jgi:glycosyltransferase involved in cell wall biosynthesis
MSLGTPALISNIPGNREMIEDGVSGYVVPKADPQAMATALLKMYQNPQKTQTMGKEALARIKNRFNSENTIKGYEAAYQKLAAS